MNKQRVWIFYPGAVGFSGQTAATELIIKGLSARGFCLIPVCLPAFNRAEKQLTKKYIPFFSGMLLSWLKLLRLLFVRRPIVYFNHGQSLVAFLRLGIPHLVLSYLNQRVRIVTSLHGSVFMTWSDGNGMQRFLKRLLMHSDVVTVLGDNQRERLIELGIPPDKLRVVYNTCEFDPTSLKPVDAAQTPPCLRTLFLSLLIESKGFCEYIDALELIAERHPHVLIDAVLCGPPAFSKYCERFSSESAMSAWIKKCSDALNSSPNVRFRWIPGVRGQQKRELFEQADVFVFPSRFPVEAQPLVLIEAMASGCAILASRAGEIPSTVSDECGVLLNDCEAKTIAKELVAFAENPEKQIKMATAALERSKSTFSVKTYIDQWEGIFSELAC